MSNTTSDLPTLPPAAADDIRQALATVDARLSAWTAAVVEAQAALVELSQVVTPAPDTIKQPEQPAAPAARPPDPPAAQAARQPDPPAVEVISRPEPTAAREPAPVPQEPPSQPQAAAPPVPEPEPPAPMPDQHKASQEEDEALLASLDPETAKQIRVMRRLSFEAKSVRELLQEYEQLRNVQDSSEQRKKSWWSRG